PVRQAVDLPADLRVVPAAVLNRLRLHRRLALGPAQPRRRLRRRPGPRLPPGRRPRHRLRVGRRGQGPAHLGRRRAATEVERLLHRVRRRHKTGLGGQEDDATPSKLSKQDPLRLPETSLRAPASLWLYAVGGYAGGEYQLLAPGGPL